MSFLSRIMRQNKKMRNDTKIYYTYYIIRCDFTKSILKQKQEKTKSRIKEVI